jgi:hypothetical protein
MRRRILRWYVRLKLLEPGDASKLSADEVAQRLAELDRIDATVNTLVIPLGFANQLYDLRQHIEVVRRRLSSDYALPAPRP